MCCRGRSTPYGVLAGCRSGSSGGLAQFGGSKAKFIVCQSDSQVGKSIFKIVICGIFFRLDPSGWAGLLCGTHRRKRLALLVAGKPMVGDDEYDDVDAMAEFVGRAGGGSDDYDAAAAA